MGVNEFPPDFMLVQAYSLEMCQTFHRRVLFQFLNRILELSGRAIERPHSSGN